MLRRSNPAGILTYLGEGSQIEGQLKAKGQVRIDGIVKGSVEVDGDLEVGPKGLIDGDYVHANNIQVHGQIKAQVQAREKLSLSKTAQLEGDVRARALDIEAGAVFVGRSQTGEPKALPRGED